MHDVKFSDLVHAQLGYHITGAEIEQGTPQDRAVPEFWVRRSHVVFGSRIRAIINAEICDFSILA